MSEPTRAILNVDDYAPGRYARTRLLQQGGFSVLEAATGVETLRIVEEHNPAVVLLDVNLPDMNGFEVCKLIRDGPKGASTIIIHISASSVQNAHQVHGLDSGADSYLVEPVDPAVLIATVKAFLRTRQAEEALRRSNEELEWFAHRVAHDLRDPLRTITTSTQILEAKLKGRLEATEVKSINFVLEAAFRMDSLISGLLQYAIGGHGGSQEQVDCESVFARSIANLEAAIVSRNARITHGPLPTIVANTGLEEVLQNLLSNGIKYSRAGTPPEIYVLADDEGDSWHFTVRDSGIGIAEDDTASIFEIFRRLHGRDIPGSGIGLALTRKIVKAWGGEIWVESQLGVGSTFHFTVPKPRDSGTPTRSL